MSVGEMSVGEMSVGEMSVGEMSVGEMSIGEMFVGEMSVGELSRIHYNYRRLQLVECNAQSYSWKDIVNFSSGSIDFIS